jgi:hypothetical protein
MKREAAIRFNDAQRPQRAGSDASEIDRIRHACRMAASSPNCVMLHGGRTSANSDSPMAAPCGSVSHDPPTIQVFVGRRINLLKKFALLFGLLALAVIVGAIALYKPVRIFAPQFFGLTCVSEKLCIDDVGRLEEATELLEDARRFVSDELGSLKAEPKVLFCGTRQCFANFADPAVAAQYYWGARTLLIGDRATPYIIRHELIHHWQNENFGGPNEALRLPMWFLEGMAYSLSNDPREVIPNAEANGQRTRFLEWQRTGGDWRTPPRQ